MAQRRMFALKVVDTDEFLDMSHEAQLLYFHLCMRADDDGFVSSPNRIMRMIDSSEEDFKELIKNGLIISFESGVCVVRDWKISNYIQKDRYTPTRYLDEMAQLIVEKNGSYSKK